MGPNFNPVKCILLEKNKKERYRHDSNFGSSSKSPSFIWRPFVKKLFLLKCCKCQKSLFGKTGHAFCVCVFANRAQLGAISENTTFWAAWAPWAPFLSRPGRTDSILSVFGVPLYGPNKRCIKYAFVGAHFGSVFHPTGPRE